MAGTDGAAARQAGEQAWRSARGLTDIQYAPVPPDPVPKPSPPPEWLVRFLKFIGTHVLEPLGNLFAPLGRLLGRSWNLIEWLLLIGAVLGLAWIAWTLLWPLWRDRAARRPQDAPEWAPTREAALALLEDADRLASEGRFGEAAHLLLLRSVGQIATARPDWLSPSSTAREIAGLQALPNAARHAFAVIAQEVERSLFALQGLTAEDWSRARTAYSRFALERLERPE